MNLTFEPIDMQRQGLYRKLFAACPQKPSDYSFGNLWGWGREYGLQWAFEDDLVWLRRSQSADGLWAPVGDWHSVDWAARLVGDEPLTFTRVPEVLLQLWRDQLGERLQAEEARGQWDYIYSVAELVALKGNRFHKKKNLLRQFNKNYDYTYQPLDNGTIAAARNMQEDWCTWRDCESAATLAAENRAIARVFDAWGALEGIFGGGLWVEGELAAYTVAEPLGDDMLVIHFEKGAPQYKGVYQAVNQIFLEHLQQPYTHVNREQDLDEEGLRRAKLSYHPVDFLRKYRVRID
jgi:hypothetical protein